MITVGMNYEILEGKEEIFEKAFANVLKAMKEMKGHERSFLFRDVHKKNSYLIISEWSNRGTFDAFVQSDRFANVVTWGKEQILASRPRHQIYETPA